MVIIITMKIINNKTMYMKCKIDMAMLLNTFTANDELSCSPGFLYFCQLRDNSYFRDPLFLPTTSYLVVPGSFNFVNYEITCTTLFLIFHLFTQKQMDFIIFVGKLKTQRLQVISQRGNVKRNIFCIAMLRDILQYRIWAH